MDSIYAFFSVWNKEKEKNVTGYFQIEMDEIFANTKSILVVWVDDTDPKYLPAFQDILQSKAKQAQIAFENVQMLFECKFIWLISTTKIISSNF